MNNLQERIEATLKIEKEALSMKPAQWLQDAFQLIRDMDAIIRQAEPFLNQYVLVRTYSAGLFAGYLVSRVGKKVVLKDSRQLWHWHTANNGLSISEIAQFGLNLEKSKLTCKVAHRMIEDVEIIPCTIKAMEDITGAKMYVAN